MSRGGYRFGIFCERRGRLCIGNLREQALSLVRIGTVRVFFSQQCQLFAGPIVCPQVVVAECQKIEGIGRDRLVGVQLHDLIEAMCSGEIGAPPIIELADEEMCLCQKVVTVLDSLERWTGMPASWKIFLNPFKGFEGLLNGAWITLESLGQFQLAFSDAEHGLGGQDVGTMEVEEMGIFDDGLRIFFFLEEGFSSLHDDVGIVVLFDRIAQENLLVGVA